MKSYVWYVSYGSNMLRSRFYCYIQGGIPKGSVKYHTGCRDKSFPLKEKNIIIHRELYFAKGQSSWGRGGVAFIKPELDDNICTYGKMYLITKEQFEDVVRQENDLSGDLNLNMDAIIEMKYMKVFNDAWYDQINFIGFDENWPVFTFTHHSFLNRELCPPNHNYINCLRDGLMEAYRFTDEEALYYLKSHGGNN